MAAGDTLQGRRYADVDDPTVPHERMGEGGYRREGGVWHAVTPGDQHGASLAKHEITEHDDGTITASPSILRTIPGLDYEWHGYLERGVWREV